MKFFKRIFCDHRYRRIKVIGDDTNTKCPNRVVYVWECVKCGKKLYTKT